MIESSTIGKSNKNANDKDKMFSNDAKTVVNGESRTLNYDLRDSQCATKRGYRGWTEEYHYIVEGLSQCQSHCHQF